MRRVCRDHPKCAAGCEGCQAQNRAYLRAWKKGHRMGHLVDSTPAREHIVTLVEAGYSLSSIARRSGVSLSAIYNLSRGVNPTIHVDTSEAILGTRAGDAVMVPAVGVHRRLQHLALMGWSTSRLAEELGVTQQMVSLLTAGRTRETHVTTFERVVRFFSAHWQEDGGSTRAKGYARRNGYVPAAAWDDIDNPRERPKGVAA